MLELIKWQTKFMNKGLPTIGLRVGLIDLSVTK